MIAENINTTTSTELCQNGLNALKNTLGVTNTLKFLEQFDSGGSGDYTLEKYQDNTPEPSDEEIRRMFGFD